MPILRVLTYNVLYGGGGREERLRAVVQAIRPDIAIFTEARATLDFEVIAGAVGSHRVYSGRAEQRDRVAIVSRWPIVASAPSGPRWARFKWVSAAVQLPTGPILTLVGVHLTPQPLWPFELWRSREVGSLLRCLAAGSDLHLVAGDFNAISIGDAPRWHRALPWVRAQWILQAGAVPRWALRRLTAAGYVDCYRARNPGRDGFTVPAWDPQARIDYLFASRTLGPALRSADVGEPVERSERSNPRRSVLQLLGRAPVPSLAGEASDHLPVWADFELD